MSLAKQLNDFCYKLFQNKTSLENIIKTIKDEEFFKRVLFNRLYYSLFHKYLKLDDELRDSSVKQHKPIKKKLIYSNNTKSYQQFVKLQNLRIWADYKFSYNEEAKNINLNILLRDLYGILKIKNV